jgi:hypothetical protein
MKSKLLFGLIAVVCLTLVSCSKQSKLDWELKRTVKAYQKVGKTNPAWDEPVKRALTEFASLTAGDSPQNDMREEIIRTNCDLAINAGCDDPMVRYMYDVCPLFHVPD